jgi:hypothetical protein
VKQKKIKEKGKHSEKKRRFPTKIQTDTRFSGKRSMGVGIRKKGERNKKLVL